MDRPPIPDRGDIKIGDLWKHRSAIVAAIAKYPAKRARTLSTVLEHEHGLLVKWKALENYVLREHLWTTKQPSPPSTMHASSSSSIVASSAAAASIVAPSSIIEAKIRDLPSHRDTILLAIRSNPGVKSIALATILELSLIHI